jgi:hypothetical protein
MTGGGREMEEGKHEENSKGPGAEGTGKEE